MAEIKFEDALKKLEKIVESLEAGDLSLEDSMAKYEEGITLSKACQKKLELAKKKVELLIKSKDGKVSLEPFEDLKKRTKKTKTGDEFEF